MPLLQEIKDSFLHLLFPHVCAGCGSDSMDKNSMLCARCMEALPETHFEHYAGNPVEKKFWGRLPLQAATAQYYFTRESLMQRLIHRFKYQGDEELGLQLGRLMGDALKRSGRFAPDALVPLPLFANKERKRGFNQAAVLCQGIADYLQVPVLKKAVIRPQATETQTRKGRIERWQNMEGKFVLANTAAVTGKKLLLVDDVVTTGATLEACGAELLQAGGTELSIACLCYAAH
ncbi:MAG: ComF family protein [Chitinophagaceae bacterium]